MNTAVTNEPSQREVLVLHRYWIWADAMRLHFLQEISPISHYNPDSEGTIHAHMYMSYWYAALHVVIEGWEALHLTDPTVDSLLASPSVKLLKRYRNGVFHFQRKYWDQRVIGFVSGGAESAAWVHQLHDELGRVLLATLRASRLQPSIEKINAPRH